jgi:lipid II:glycine glycyltransferase (peptidoglycan interpeptide bridge formation enzyme)
MKYMVLNKDNNFLQSEVWRKFQEAVGNKTFIVKEESFSASIIEHQLPVVGKYFYCPRGPIMKLDPSTTLGMTNVINLARRNKAGWIRIDPENDQTLELIKNNISLPIKKAPHDMQPREILVMDISKSEEELLAGMKSKTRYNINLAEKKGVSLRITNLYEYTNSNDVDRFVELVKITAKRNKITSHPENYYRKMLEVIPSDILKLYVAEYENKIIAANLVIFYGDTATYLHGATDDEYRNVMAPYLLQWQAIKDAKKMGYRFYDFGGISTNYLPTGQAGESDTNIRITNNWSGITKFKTGFTPTTEPVKFPGSFDLVINTPKYFIYRLASRLRNIFSSIGR